METNQLVLQMLGGLFNFEIVLRHLKNVLGNMNLFTFYESYALIGI